MLHQTYMPSVLIELGFLTNDKEGAYLNSTKGQSEMANSIKTSIVEYKESLDAIYEFPIADTPDPEIANNDAKIDVYNAVVFRVQIAAGSKDIELNPSNFNGLDKLSKKKSGDIYKYFYGSSTSYSLIKRLREVAVDKGFDSSFVVAFRNDQPISLEEALKTDKASN